MFIDFISCFLRMFRTRAFDFGEPNPKPGVKRRNTSPIDDEAVPSKKPRGNEDVSFYLEKEFNKILMQFSGYSSSK